jgi:hypothetical protein
MTFITKKSLSRRTVLRGMGVSLALPLFDSMVPAQTPLRKTAAAPRTRLACIEMVHGAAGSTAEGTAKGYWIPATAGRDFDFTMSLKPVEQFRDYLTIISNTDLHHAEAFNATEDGADHFRSSAVYLTAAHPKQTEGSDVRCGVSLDQIYAQECGQDTPLPSIQLCIENVDASGSCGYNYSCVYSDTISWANPSTPLPMTIDPRMAFENLFGDGGSQQERMTRQRENRSILDQILGEANALRKQLPARDQNRLNTYLENVREIERRIQKIEQYNASGATRELPAAPLGVPDSWEEHVKLMFDLQVLAFAAEVTRVSAFKMSRDTSQRVFPGSGVKSPFHSLSHHGEKPETVEELARLNRYHVSTVAYFLDKLKNTPDGDGNLLDHSLVVYGSPMGDSNVHGHKRLPLFFAGHAGGQLAGNQHVATPDGTPMANAWLAVLKKLGVQADRFGDSNGALAI